MECDGGSGRLVRTGHLISIRVLSIPPPSASLPLLPPRGAQTNRAQRLHDGIFLQIYEVRHATSMRRRRRALEKDTFGEERERERETSREMKRNVGKVEKKERAV